MTRIYDLTPKERADYHRAIAKDLEIAHPNPGEAGRQVIEAIRKRADEIEAPRAWRFVERVAGL